MQVMTVVEGKISETKTSEFLAMYASVGSAKTPRLEEVNAPTRYR